MAVFRSSAARPTRAIVVTGALSAALFALGLSAAAAAAPRVVASIPPVHSLAAMAMEGIGAPVLLLPGGASPHAYALRPSESRALSAAALVVIVGSGLEPFLAKPLRAATEEGRVLEVARLPGMKKLPVRAGGLWSAEDDGHGHGHGHGQDRDRSRDRNRDHDHDHGAGDGTDPHLWLDTGNARIALAGIAGRLARIDPANAAVYRANRDRWDVRLAALAPELRSALAPVRAEPFLVLHDAWQYFEAEFGLRGVGAIALSPERPPGARRLVALRGRLQESGARCVFSEPQFPAAIVGTLIRETPARTAAIDPLGADLAPGADLYPALMRGIARTLVGCLSSGSPGGFPDPPGMRR